VSGTALYAQAKIRTIIIDLSRTSFARSPSLVGLVLFAWSESLPAAVG
jgi:hypothetical protein